MTNSIPQKVHDAIDRDLVLDNKKLNDVMVKFEREIKKGLSKAHHDESEVKCFVTYVQNLPMGTEKGKFLALDLGGTNFRVLLIILKGEEDYEFKSKIFAIPQSLMVGSGRDLFDHIAQCLAEFIKDMNIQNEILPLGFTFSFPCQQKGLTTGTLIKWTKGFNCSDVVEKNVVELLEEAIQRRNDIKILICAILNDTTGTLMSCAWKYQDCKIGVIIGTGSNACYVEKVRYAEWFDKPGKFDDESVIINTEFGAFGDKGSLDDIRTCFDIEVDKNSINPSNQLFEKMISGMYMGELVRLVIVKLASKGLIFNGKISKKFMQRETFFTKYISEIEHEENNVFHATKEILYELDIENPTEEDCRIVRYCCELISKRAAQLVSSGLAVLMLRIGDPKITIGVDGSVYRFHPRFHDLMTETIKQLIPSNYEFKLVLSEDGSGRGAALVAAVASKDLQ
ncbi:hypothetical protein PVAND_001898 [Polypedilum vanderplanki]|uniref:Phosphotransferase n=1 Tax=Polypedilum vanderplanki TaxID=319348 RepID=A0A9J6BQQ6_POLVA|nr:hypothetical protein PVAND_001898 [Polypedilum vanderplanki]